MASTPLESNPWFHYFIARKTVTKEQMIAIALKITRERFTSISPEKCEYGHAKHWHPFAGLWLCHACQTNLFVKRIATNDTAERESLADNSAQWLQSTIAQVDNVDQRGHLSDQDVSYTLNH